MADISVTRKRKRPESPEPEIACKEMFYPLTVHIVAEDDSDFESSQGDDLDLDQHVQDAEAAAPDASLPIEIQEPLPPATTYDPAIAHIDSLRSHLTQSMALDLTSLLSVLNSDLFLAGTPDYTLITQIVNPETTNDESPPSRKQLVLVSQHSSYVAEMGLTN